MQARGEGSKEEGDRVEGMRLRGRLSSMKGSPALLALVSLLALVVVGFVVADDYGMSWDEERNYLVGVDALQAYTGAGQYLDYLDAGDPLAHHGPSYFMLWAVLTKVGTAMVPWWIGADARHFVNFLMFVLSVVGVYLLSVRVMERRYAWMTSALFATQPLLFGHGFINQKDTPFMAMFVLSVVVGMAAVDWADRAWASGAGQGQRRGWGEVSSRGRWVAAIYVGLTAAIVLDLVYLGRGLETVKDLVQRAYEGEAWGLVQRVFDVLATDAYKTPLELYLMKVEWVYWMARVVVVLGLVGIGVILTYWLMPDRVREGWGRNWRGLMLAVGAGAAVGFTVSIRPIGGFAGVLVGVYGLYRLRGRGWWLLGVYGGAALLMMYMTWPYLWDSPVQRLWESMAFTIDFEAKQTVYRGVAVSYDSLPWHYFPTLASIELTEPVVVLFALGVGVGAWRWAKGKVDGGVMGVLALWLGVPLLALIGFGVGIYDNIRQLHFVLVPVILIAGMGMAAILVRLKRVWLQFVVLGILLLPGLIGIVRLHPYESAYFNTYVGGVRGAAGQYGMDRFCTSYREAMEGINEVAEPGALVLAPGSPDAAAAYARPDLEVTGDVSVVGEASFLIACKQVPHFENMRRILVVGRETAIFAEVYQRPPP